PARARRTGRRRVRRPPRPSAPRRSPAPSPAEGPGSPPRAACAANSKAPSLSRPPCSSSLVLNGRREDGAVVSYHGPCEPAVAVSLASSRSSEPATELGPERSYTTSGDATEPLLASFVSSPSSGQL